MLLKALDFLEFYWKVGSDHVFLIVEFLLRHWRDHHDVLRPLKDRLYRVKVLIATDYRARLYHKILVSCRQRPDLEATLCSTCSWLSCCVAVQPFSCWKSNFDVGLFELLYHAALVGLLSNIGALRLLWRPRINWLARLALVLIHVRGREETMLRRLGLAHSRYLPFKFLDVFDLLSSLGILLQYLFIFGMKLCLQIFDLLLKFRNITLAAGDDVFQLTNTPYIGFTFINQRFILLITLC